MQGSAIDPPQIQERLWDGFTRTALGFDIGANVGQSIVHMFDVAEEVVAWEPSVESYEWLSREWGAHPGLTLMNAALSDQAGTVGLCAAPKKLASGQLVTHDFAADWNGEGDWDLTGAVERQVMAYTLDGYCKLNGRQPGFLKIDVEGHELRVLKGGPQLLDRGVEMLIEVHSQMLGVDIQYLLGDRYRVETVLHPNYPPGSDLARTHFWFRCFPL